MIELPTRRCSAVLLPLIVVSALLAAGCSSSPQQEGRPSQTVTPVGAGPAAGDLAKVIASSNVDARRYLYPTTTGTRDDTQNWADVFLPRGNHPDGSVPLVVLIHGGSWLSTVGADSFVTFSRRLAERGLAVYNVEYRRVGSGGGWPTTFQDVAAALDFVPAIQKAIPQIDTRNAVVVGHSAGGQLAMWAGTRHKLGTGEVGADPKFRPTSVVSLAGPLDMRKAVALGDDRVVRALGGQPSQVPDRYASVDPIQNIDPATPTIAMAGAEDRVVPPILSETYVAADHAAGGRAVFVLLPKTDHGLIVDPTSSAFPVVLETISRAAHHAAG
ncbi:alpha/beta hydrolase family protein [Gordonia sp. DT30]|uniref:alpha/beta hydrolase family protein n=1 Tax=unclassified Gordonia (in: high G+C Gram-positive bacteria) TaxID=2657482 RepID=UPI003CF8BD96